MDTAFVKRREAGTVAGYPGALPAEQEKEHMPAAVRVDHEPAVVYESS